MTLFHSRILRVAETLADAARDEQCTGFGCNSSWHAQCAVFGRYFANAANFRRFVKLSFFWHLVINTILPGRCIRLAKQSSQRREENIFLPGDEA